MGQKGAFKNVKLGKNVHRQLKRRGPPAYPADQVRRGRECVVGMRKQNPQRD